MALISYMRTLSAKGYPLPMKNSLRLLVLSGMLALLVSPAFADGPLGGGPGGGGNPLPPTSGGTNTTTTNTTINGTNTTGTTTILGEILGILGAVGF